MIIKILFILGIIAVVGGIIGLSRKDNGGFEILTGLLMILLGAILIAVTG